MARKDRTGNRKKRENFKLQKPRFGYHIIFTDTEKTEKNYIQGLKDALPDEIKENIIIKIYNARTQKLVSACEKETSYALQHAQGWIMFDRDQVNNFDDIIKEAESKGIGVAWSNPCIEIWFEAYFGKMTKYADSVKCCEGFSATFEKNTGHKYDKGEKEIYALLNEYGNEMKAIEVAKERFSKHSLIYTKPSEMNPCTTVYELIKTITPSE